jgi:hypothetical protein
VCDENLKLFLLQDKDEVIDLICDIDDSESGRRNAINSVLEVHEELIASDLDLRWYWMIGECDICEFEQVLILPAQNF